MSFNNYNDEAVTVDYFELNITEFPAKYNTEILIALLADKGFESFVEEDSAIRAYIPVSNISINDIKHFEFLNNKRCPVKYECKVMKDKNWNEEWEKNYTPVVITGKCCIRAPFHKIEPNYKYDIVIEPKMSFGTAHHETTSLMLEQMLNIEINNKSVLDMGCGTGVLAILAAKMGAVKITAVDNDEWAYNNTVENIKKNNVSFIDVLLGDAKLIKGLYDLLIANINRNTLIADIPVYAEHMKKSALMLLSGFYESDVSVIKEKAFFHGLKYIEHICKNNWAVLKFQKS